MSDPFGIGLIIMIGIVIYFIYWSVFCYDKGYTLVTFKKMGPPRTNIQTVEERTKYLLQQHHMYLSEHGYIKLTNIKHDNGRCGAKIDSMELYTGEYNFAFDVPIRVKYEIRGHLVLLANMKNVVVHIETLPNVDMITYNSIKCACVN